MLTTNTNLELAWMAGIIDGEDTIGVYGFQNEERKRKKCTYSKCAVIHVGNSEKELIYPFYQRFGGKLKEITSENINKQHQIKTTKSQWCWTLTFGRGGNKENKKIRKINFLQLILPYLHCPSKIQGTKDCLEFLGQTISLEEIFGGY